MILPLAVLGLSLGVAIGRLFILERRLRAEVKAHAATVLQLRREVIAEWVSKMPRTGKVSVDRLCPDDVVYILNPNLVRRDP